MNRQGYLFWVLIGLIVALGTGTGCTPLPAKVTEPTSEPSSITSPLALPTDVSPLLSPLPTPTPHVAPAVRSVLPPIQTSPLPPFLGSPQDPVAWAIADLAQRLGLEPTGTPSAEADHTSVRPTPTEPIATPSPPFVEPTPRTPLPPASQSPARTEPERVVRLAMEDLARRLGVGLDKIVLISVTADEFPASNLGCPSPKKTPLPIPAFVTGQVIVLQSRGEYYVYHARGRQAIFCGRR